MSNTNQDLLRPEFWAASFDMLDVGEYGLHKRVSNSLTATLANYGDKVTVPLSVDLGQADDWVAGEAIVATSVNQEVSALELNQSKRKTFTLTGADLSLTPYNLIEKYGQSAAKSLLQAVNTSIYAEMLKTKQAIAPIAAGTGISYASASALETSLFDNEVTGELNLELAGFDYNKIRTDANFSAYDKVGDSMVIRQGQVGKIAGLDTFRNNGIKMSTIADKVGAVNNPSNYLAGAKVIVVEGFTGVPSIGDVVSFAGVTGVYNIVDFVATGGNLTSITLGEGLAGALADEAAVTLYTTRNAIAYRADGLAFASRPYAVLPAGVGVANAIVDAHGLPVRISVWNDGKLGVNVQMDILYGCKLVKDSRVARAALYL